MVKYKKALEKYFRLSSYISAAQIFLKDNFFLERALRSEDIKDRLLGHWGTTPGINLIYGAGNVALKEYKDFDFIYIVGPGHGFPAYQAGTFLDGSISKFYPYLPYNKKGLSRLIANFSVPYGFPSHINPEAPGAILEGGELGYSLSTAFGAVLDESNLIAITLVGDGEAETGPLSASWSLNRFLNPKKDGAVLPVLHLNKYKISGPTIFSSMSDEQIQNFFSAYGYDTLFIDFGKGKIFEDTLSVFQNALDKILNIKNNWSCEDGTPNWPVVVLKSPKGWGAPDKVGDRKIEDNYESHQVVFKNLKNDVNEQDILQNWLASYKISELIKFKENGDITLDKDIDDLLEKGERSLGQNIYARRGDLGIDLPDPGKLLHEGAENKDSMSLVGDYLVKIIERNENKFRIFSPDETYSNHIDSVFKVTTRKWLPHAEGWVKDISCDGRVIELLSEHALFGMLQGYTLLGRHGFFVSYEAFAEIVSSMLDQYVKFVKFARNVSWRKDLPSLNIILSSLLERQDHNGFSHQNPSFISNNVNRDLDIVNVFLPADKIIALYTIEHALKLKNQVNIFAIGKRIKKTFLTQEEAKEHVKCGVSLWKAYSDESPDIYFVSAGDYVTQEMIAAIELFKEFLPNVALGFVNFNKLDIIEEQGRRLLLELFEDRPLVFHYHGYPATIKKLLYGKYDAQKTIIHGYIEQGSTTTPFDMLARNNLTRYDAVLAAVELLQNSSLISFDKAQSIKKSLINKKMEIIDYIKTNKLDPDFLQY